MKIEILNIKIDLLSKESLLNEIGIRLQKGTGKKIIATVNPEFIVEAQTDKNFRHILNNSWFSTADGIGISVAANYNAMLAEKTKINGWIKLQTLIKVLFLISKKEKTDIKISVELISGSDITSEICTLCASLKKRVFFLGGLGNVSQEAAMNMMLNNPLLKIDSAPLEEKKLNEKINHFKPDVLFVALGAPKQEKWINENIKKFPSVKLAMGVGGTFDFLAGQVPRAPEKWRGSFEWLYRLLQNPSRIKRIWKATVVYLWYLLKRS